MKKILLIFSLLAMAVLARGEEPRPLRPVTSAYMIEMGAASMADTYLSPLTYRGVSAAFAYERMQAMKFAPDDWVMQLTLRAAMDHGTNLAENAVMWRINGEARWGMLRRWQGLLTPGLTLALGGSTGIEVGCLYNRRNSNNPASAKAAWTIDLTAYAAYNFRIGRLPVTVRYQPTLPIIGMFFSPDYDELYYEIYLGNDSGLAHCAWFGSRFAMTNFVTADLHFGSTSLRVGYRNTILSSEASHLVTNASTNSFVLGISGEWISLSQRHELSRDARIISALY